MLATLIVVGVVVVIAGLFSVGVDNRFVALRERGGNAFARHVFPKWAKILSQNF